MSTKLQRRAVLAGLGAAGASMTIKRSRAESAPIKLGFFASMSGGAAIVGFAHRIGAEAARNYINKNGGISGHRGNHATEKRTFISIRSAASRGLF